MSSRQTRRVLRTILATAVLAGLSTKVRGDASDPFAGKQSFETAAPKGNSFSDGDHGVDEQRGAATWSFPIVVPPGRQGMEPRLALSYSSQAPLRGGIAVGFALNLPSIEVDGYRADGSPRYRSSFGGAGGQLIETTSLGDVQFMSGAQSFRAQFDAAFTHYQLRERLDSAPSWVVRSSDGRRYEFDAERGGRWYLTAEQDAFGNRVEYTWASAGTPTYQGLELVRIAYTTNVTAGITTPHAEVTFTYAALETCAGSAVPIGAELRFHGGSGFLESPRRLIGLTTWVRDTPSSSPRRVRDLTFGYDTTQLVSSCGSARAPLRYLTSIAEQARSPQGITAVVPTITLSYGERARSFADSYAVAGSGGAGKSGLLNGETRTLLDVDGDGIQDVVRMEERANSSGQTVCTLVWQRGQYLGGFETQERTRALPTIPWQNGVSPNKSADYQERCALNGQFFARRETPPPGCASSTVQTYRSVLGYHFLDWNADGHLDLLTNLWRAGNVNVELTFYASNQPQGECGTNSVETSVGSHTVCTCQDGYTEVTDETPETLDCEVVPHDFTSLDEIIGQGDGPVGPYHPDTVHCVTGEAFPETALGASSQHVWRVFLGNGNGFSVGMERILTPIELPLPGTEGQYKVSASGESLPELVMQTIIDVDGDGWLDLFSTPSDVGLGSTPHVSVGHRTPGGFAGETWSKGLAVIRNPSGFKPNWSSGLSTVTMSQTSTLRDMNGDGRPDLLFQPQSGSLRYLPNMGDRFGQSYVSLVQGGAVEETKVKVTSWQGSVPSVASRFATRKLIDVDADGRPDLVVFPESGSTPVVYISHGDVFSSTAVALPSVWMRARRSLSSANGSWLETADIADATGDGLPDLVTYDSTGISVIATDLYGPGRTPPRLLQSVNNGRGATVSFEYSSSNDAAVRELREGDPSWHMPQPQWLVSAVRIAPGTGLAEIRTDYRYGLPQVKRVQVNQDDVAQPASFLGFARVRVIQPQPDGAAGRAESLHRYAYLADGRGYAAQSEIWSRGANGLTLESLSIGAWEPRALFGGAVTVVLPVSSRSLRCEDHQLSPEPGVLDSCHLSRHFIDNRTTWTAYPNSTSPLMYLAGDQLTWRSDGTGGTQSLKHWDIRFGIVAYKEDYRVQVGQEDTRHVSAGDTPISTPIAKSQTVLDYWTGLPIESREWFGPGANDYVRTVRTFDVATGNLLTVKRPEQVRQGTSAVSTLTYDDFKLTVTSARNELGHTVYTTTDIGTGVEVDSKGPNFRVVSSGSCGRGGCLLEWRWDEDKTVIDGFGRPVESWTTYRFGGASDSLVKIATMAYNDVANTVTMQTLRDPNEATPFWITSVTTYDGAGRVKQEAQRRESGLSDVVTRYEYDASGAMITVWSPNPVADASPDVAHQWTRDSLGRVTGFRRPDGTGVDVAYDRDRTGFVEERSVFEVTADGSGNTTLGRYDVSGRLVEVEELVPGQSVNPWAYIYDDFGRMVEVDDPEGNATWMTHDWLGRRTAIQREGRIWRYEYDHDGNVVAETSPLPAGVAPGSATALLYRGTNIYDSLGRMTVHRPAPRAMSLDDRRRLWVGPTHFTYDEGVNGVGQLTRVEQHIDPGTTGISNPSTPPYLKVELTYEANGRVGLEERWFNPNATTTATPLLHQRVTRTFDTGGTVTSAVWDDEALPGFGTGNVGRWSLTTDARNLVKTVDYRVTATSTAQRVADYGTRMKTGAPVTRLTSGFGGLYRQWQYDPSGRVKRDDIQTSSTNKLAWRQYTFSGAGDVLSVTGQTRAPNGTAATANATFTYDARHRLKTASGPNGYTATMSYAANGNIAAAKLSGMPDSRMNRDVEYLYGAVDPQAVDAIIVKGTAANPIYWAQFSYDSAGNITRRGWPVGQDTWLTWDGDDLLREVSGPGGVESYHYDHSGARAWAVETTQSGKAYRVWFGELETNIAAGGSATGATRYLHVADGGGVLARAEKVGTATPTVELQFSDALANLMLGAKLSGSTVVSTAYFHYGAFGEVLAQGGESTHRRQFNGKENDRASGLRYYGARYYEPLAMRWVSADPLYRVVPDIGMAQPQRMNLYGFSGNNPLRYIDPDGRDFLGGLWNGAKSLLSQPEVQLAVVVLCPTCSGNSARLEKGAKGVAQKAQNKVRTVKQAFRGDGVLGVVHELNPMAGVVGAVGDFGGAIVSGDTTRMGEAAFVLGVTIGAMVLGGKTGGGGGGTGAKPFKAPKIAKNKHGQLTNGAYTLDADGMAAHLTGNTRGGKSQFLFRVDADKAVLDAAAYADEQGLWVGSKAKVPTNAPVGVLGSTGELTTWINVYRTISGFVHGAPGSPQ